MTEYNEVKDSNTKWLKMVPKHWDIHRLKYHLRFSELRNPGNTLVLSLYREYGIVIKDSRDDNHNATSEDTSNYRYVSKGDFVINKMKAWQGSVAVSDYDGIVSPAYYVYKFTDDCFSKRYFHYLMRNKAYSDEFRSLSGGIRIGQWDLPKLALENIPVLIPPKKEQTAIGFYLDDLCGQIDSVIEEVKASIDEYKTWKASIIFEAVTKGLDTTAKMKDSAIDLIGKIPENWSTRRLRYLCSVTTGNQDTQNAVPDGEYPFYVRSPIVERANTYTFDGEAVLMAGDGAGAGKVFHHAHGKVAIHQRVYCFFDFKDITPRYFFYFMSNRFSVEMERGSAKSTVPSVRLPMLQNFSITLPEINVQKLLCEYLDVKVNNLDSIIDEKQALIADLESYKRSLIYEAVTGKKKVV